MLNFYLQPEKSNCSSSLGQGLPFQGTRAPTRMKSCCAGQRRKWDVDCNLEEFGWIRVLEATALDLRPDRGAPLSVSERVVPVPRCVPAARDSHGRNTQRDVWPKPTTQHQQHFLFPSPLSLSHSESVLLLLLF